jgi:hypothetical protein
MENENTDPPTREKKMHNVYIKIHNASNTMHSDQMGRFPATSSSGNQYIMVLVEVDGNCIDAEPMKNRSAESMVKAYLTLWKQITESGSIKPTTHILNNKASAELKEAIKKNCIIQLIPPDNHRRNLVERAIQTFKNHFKAILAGVDDSFPMRHGTNYCHKQYLPSISSNNQMLPQKYQHTNTSEEALTTTRCH